MKRLAVCALLIFLLTGCSSSPNGRYQHAGDGIVLDTTTGVVWVNGGPEEGWVMLSKGPIPTK